MSEEGMRSRTEDGSNVGMTCQEIDLVIGEVVSVSNQRVRQTAQRFQIIHRARVSGKSPFTPEIKADEHFEELAAARFE